MHGALMQHDTTDTGKKATSDGMGVLWSLIYFSLLHFSLSFRGGCKSVRIVSRQSAARDEVTLPDSIALRNLGSYERLLSRTVPSSGNQAISHASAMIFSARVETEALFISLCYAVARHPMLRVRRLTDAKASSYLTERPSWGYLHQPLDQIARACLHWQEVSEESSGNEWQQYYQQALSTARFEEDGPRWRVKVFSSPSKTSLVFVFDHGIDDQQSIHLIVRDMLHALNRPMNLPDALQTPSLPMPDSIEQAIAPVIFAPKTLLWACYQVWNSLQTPLVLPLQLRREGKALDPDQRSTFCKFFELRSNQLQRLRGIAKGKGLTLTHLLSAAMLYVTYDLIFSQSSDRRESKLRFLLSVGLRPYADPSHSGGGGDFTGGTVACASGAVDFVLPVPPIAPLADKQHIHDNEFYERFYDLALQCKEKGDWVIEEAQLVSESVRLFDFGMKAVDILKAVDLDAASSTLGRGYSCGVSNMGLLSLYNQGGVGLERGYYATSHGRNGVLCQLSCLSVVNMDDTVFCGCLQFPCPIVSDREGAEVKRALLLILEGLIADSD